jgi:hypothetical protein
VGKGILDGKAPLVVGRRLGTNSGVPTMVFGIAARPSGARRGGRALCWSAYSQGGFGDQWTPPILIAINRGHRRLVAPLASL